jgi:hypothetical protein
MIYVDKSLSLPEIFDRVGSKGTIDEKVTMLKRYDTKALRWFVDSTYNRDFSDIIIPEYKKSNNPPGISFININKAIPRIEVAIKNKDNERIRDRNLILVLEGLSAEEAALIEKLIKGERKITGVSKTVFKKVYPEFFRTEEKN